MYKMYVCQEKKRADPAPDKNQATPYIVKKTFYTNLKKIKVSVNYEDTFFLENIIYNELILRGYAVYTGKTYKGEIDFVAIDGKKKCFIHLNIEDFLLHKERLLLS